MSQKTADTGRVRTGTDTIPVENAEHLRAIAGPHDRNLLVLEQLLEARLEAPGGCVRITGDDGARARAREAVRVLRGDVEAGRSPDEDDVRRLALRLIAGEAPLDAAGVVHVGARSFQARTRVQADYLAALADPQQALVFGVGPAGTGKTFLAVVYGAALLQARQIERLVVARPAVEAGEKLGFLPGDLYEKVDPYMLPIWDALRDCLGQKTVEKRREDGRIEVAPLAFMRGRTLRDAFVIVDEAQNATDSQMQMVLTRIGEGSRMVVTGDPSQVDLPAGARSGLAHALGILGGIEGVRSVTFTSADVQRHHLVGRIVEAYERDAAGGGARLDRP